jgi:spermidine synthase
MPRDRSFPLLLACFLFSGLAALIYETAWTREFSFVFGTSDLAVATVLAAYMAGLGAGAAVAGRYATRLARPVLAYGLLELGIAIAALAVPFAIGAARWLYVALFGSQEALPDAGGLATPLFYLACSFVILFVPTALMGATLPLLARHAVREDAQIGSRIGTLYAVNTTGAVAGVVLTAFVLLPEIGLRATIASAAAVNALVFAAAWALARSAPPLAGVDAAPVPAADALAVGRARWILPVILASGFASFTYEVLWVRLVGHLVGSGTQAFATMLASFLAGIAIGSAIASRLAKSARGAALGFGIAQLGVAAGSVAAFRIVNRVPDLAEWLERGGRSETWADVAVCMVTLFPSALCIGATFPFAVRVLARRGDDAGPASARVYAANTAGSIAGSVCAGFFLVPGLGFAGTLIACVAINLVLAAAASLLVGPWRRGLAAIAVAGAVALAIAPPGTPWGILRATSLGNVRAWGPVGYFGVGRSSTVLLTNQRTSYGLRTNGLPEAGVPLSASAFKRSGVTHWLTALPLLARPDARSLLLVGFGGGMALETVPETVERIDVIELEPEVIAANRHVAKERYRDPLADPRVHVHLNDARNALLLARARFDVIVSQPSHPWAGGAAHLYTHEFFSLVRSRLSPDGVFVQWIGLPFVDEALFRSLLATLSDVFPHVLAFNPPPDGSVLFLASDAPFDMEASTPRALAASPERFAEVGASSPEVVAASLLLDEQAVRELAQGAPLNRDGHNRLASRSARLGDHSLRPTIDEFIAPVDPLVRARPQSADVFRMMRYVRTSRAKRIAASLPDPVDRAVGEALAEIEEGKRVGPLERIRSALAQNPQHVEARAAMLRLSSGAIADGADPETILAPPLSDAERAVAAAWAARPNDPRGEALRALEPQLAAIPPGHPLGADAVRLRVQARIASGDAALAQQATALAETSLDDRPEPSSILLRAEASAAAGDQVGALETLTELVEHLDPKVPSAIAIVRRAQDLARSMPDDRELHWLRQNTLQRLGAGRMRPIVAPAPAMAAAR